MTNLPVNNGANFFQKVLTWGLIGGAALGAMSIFNNFIAPNLIWFLKNVWAIALLGTPVVLTALYIISNPFMVYHIAASAGRWLTGFIIKMDPLSVMDSYADFLTKKKENLDKTIVVLQGKLHKLDKKIRDLDERVAESMNYGKAAMQQQDMEQASVYGSRLTALNGSLKMLLPIQKQIKDSLEFLIKLSKNWGASITKLRDQISIKREEYEFLRDTVGGLKSAEEFINSGTQAGKDYGMSLKALEESVTQKMGYITEFERKAAPILKQISFEDAANNQAGIEQLQAMLSSDLYLPTSFDQPEKIRMQTNKTIDITPKQNKFKL